MPDAGVVACITTLNEADTIGALVRGLRRVGAPSVIQDGGSDDATVLAALTAGAEAMSAESRLSLADGLQKALGEALVLYPEAQRFVTIDAGCSHDPADLPRLLSCDADVVIGSRFVPGAVYTGRPWRARLSRIAAVACNFAQPGMRVRDWTSGYRVYSRRAVEEMLEHRYQARMHGFQIEALARLGAAGMTIEEAPITYRAGRSSFSWSVAFEATSVWIHILNHIGWRRT